MKSKSMAINDPWYQDVSNYPSFIVSILYMVVIISVVLRPGHISANTFPQSVLRMIKLKEILLDFEYLYNN